MKTFTFIASVACALTLTYGCTKEKSGDSQISNSMKSNAPDSVKKSVLGSSCKRTGVWGYNPYNQVYTVIGTFPTNANYVLPKQIWTCGNYELNNQSDGNLVIYDRTNGGLRVLWDLTRGYNKNPKFVLQTDMNFVEYDGNNNAIWDAGTYVFQCGGKSPRNARLILSNRGELHIIAESDAITTGVLGSTLTQDGQVRTGGQGYWKRFDLDENDPYGVHLAY
ncbi:hypothetical protein [Mucilaginibacter aquatilis]|uniref:Bulb-type lectin domain-containing protein n=1 Tax=Mucilaginibacter aquatilis TaxID=1517760 RepID=A0A6I4I8F9_9SPHI|nr:hypothetical protein [Mucilaginibacter aquatilis]MVN89726.1 hypothetical protein [Mucilaginibacter aquatilis]